MGALSCGYQKLLWKSKSHVSNLKHWSLHRLQNSCYYGQIQWQPYKLFLLNFFRHILKSWVKEAYRFRISFNLELHQEKTPPHASVKYNQAPLASQTPHIYFESCTMYRYIKVATIYFQGAIFPKQYCALDTVFTDAEKFNLICKCNYDSQRFQVFT